MRPVRRGASPRQTDFAEYEDAKAELVARLGLYCSYCERRIATLLAVEHIQPKGLRPYEALRGRWSNFLLGCPNCNGTKGDQDVVLGEYLLPDRDNTFAAFRFGPDGSIAVEAGLTDAQAEKARKTLRLTGLDKRMQAFLDVQGRMVALDRVAQRMEAWGIAERARSWVAGRPGQEELKDAVVELARQTGYFSVWMTVFAADGEMRGRLVGAFAGTAESGCFDGDGRVVCPAPNPDGLADGGKV